MLSEAPGRTLRMTELARQTDATLSRLSHVVTRHQGRALVERFPCPEDGRATNVRLSAVGWGKVPVVGDRKRFRPDGRVPPSGRVYGTISGVPDPRIAQDAAADELLGRDPLALLIGMLLDQHVSWGTVDDARVPHRSRSAGRDIPERAVPPCSGCEPGGAGPRLGRKGQLAVGVLRQEGGLLVQSFGVEHRRAVAA